MIPYESMPVVETEELINFLRKEHNIDPLVAKNALEAVKDGEYTLYNRSEIKAFIRAWRKCQEEALSKPYPMTIYTHFITVFDTILYVIAAGFLPKQFLLHLSD